MDVGQVGLRHDGSALRSQGGDNGGSGPEAHRWTAGRHRASHVTDDRRPRHTRPVTGPEITIAFAGDNNGEGLPDADMANAMAGRLERDEGVRCRQPISRWPTSRRRSRPGRGCEQGVHVPLAAVDPARPPGGRHRRRVDGQQPRSRLRSRRPGGLTRGQADARPIPVVGIGANDDEAFAPAHFTVKGLRIAVIGATQVLDSSLITAWTATADQGRAGRRPSGWTAWWPR